MSKKSEEAFQESGQRFRSITERKLAEDSLHESERKISTLMANLPGIAYRCLNDSNWSMEFISEGCFELTGYQPSELVGNKNRVYSDLIHSEDKEMVWATVQASITENRSFEIEYRIITAEGRHKYVWKNGIGVFEGEKLKFLEGLITDITRWKQAENELKKYQDHLEELVKERTSELEEKNRKLEKFNQLFVDREFRIKELREH